MTQQEYLANKDQLDNPQQIVLVNRQGGPKEPKMPKWFQSYKKETDTRFEKIEEQLNGSKAPKWFTSYMDKFKKDLWTKIDQKFKDFAKLNNLKYEE